MRQFLCFRRVLAALLFLTVTCVDVSLFAMERQIQPSGLTVNFLSHAGQVFLNGYPVNALLEDAAGRNEHFQFAEIGQKRPFFGWIVGSTQTNTLQTACRILVASSLDTIQAGKGDCWDSGRVKSDESVNVPYAGKELRPGQVYFWR